MSDDPRRSALGTAPTAPGFHAAAPGFRAGAVGPAAPV